MKMNINLELTFTSNAEIELIKRILDNLRHEDLVDFGFTNKDIQAVENITQYITDNLKSIEGLTK